MEYIWIFAILGVALGQTALTPKAILVKKVHDLVTNFLTEPQISRAIDITALGIHLNKPTEEIATDLYDYLMDAMSSEQLKTVNESYNAMAKDLGDEGAANVLDRIKKVVIYAVTPAVQLVRANGETPDLAYVAMARQLTPDFIHGVISLVRDTLTPAEWNSVKLHYASMLRIL